ncbi:MAG: alpha/beta hydrolase [Candidatus Lokiarchaeota archaeon]|nr:alpha/beta hydrolase [Candidatus Lokiarchaeota archaeon]
MKARIDSARLVHALSIPLVACNGLMIVAGTWSLVDPGGSVLDAFLDVLLVSSIVLNLFLAALGQVFLNHRRSRQASRLQWYFSAYLVGIGLVILGNMLVTVAYTYGFATGSAALGTTVAVAIVLNALIHFFPALAGIKLFKITRPEGAEAEAAGEVVWSVEPVRADPSWEFKPSFKKFLKVIGVACLVFIFVLSTLLPLVFIPGGRDWEAFVAGNLATTMLFALAPCTLMLARHVPRARGRGNKALLVAIMTAGCVLACTNALPIVQTGSTISSLESQFAASYGSDWQSATPASPYHPFRSAPISICDFFYTLPIEKVDERIDITYMVDKGQTLRFDWYAPEGTSGTANLLPLVVAIHGGSWRLFDKGLYNIIPTQKYIASLGYVVVDVQYGLYDEDDPTPFTLRDMVMEVANLTRFLAANPAEFHADVSRTIFLGRSAGAHLALVCGLGHDDPYFAGNYSAGFDCAGIIPFYPPANMSRIFDNSSAAFFGVSEAQLDYFDPVDLASPTSPPVLCFQGLADTLVHPVHARELQAAVRGQGGTCILGEFPHAGHAFDLFYNYPHNQVCIYYIERFLALNAA